MGIIVTLTESPTMLWTCREYIIRFRHSRRKLRLHGLGNRMKEKQIHKSLENLKRKSDFQRINLFLRLGDLMSPLLSTVPSINTPISKTHLLVEREAGSTDSLRLKI